MFYISGRQPSELYRSLMRNLLFGNHKYEFEKKAIVKTQKKSF